MPCCGWIQDNDTTFSTTCLDTNTIMERDASDAWDDRILLDAYRKALETKSEKIVEKDVSKDSEVLRSERDVYQEVGSSPSKTWMESKGNMSERIEENGSNIKKKASERRRGSDRSPEASETRSDMSNPVPSSYGYYAHPYPPPYYAPSFHPYAPAYPPWYMYGGYPPFEPGYSQHWMPSLPMVQEPSNHRSRIPTPPDPPSDLPTPQSALNDMEDEEISALLLSWYYAGYYTGRASVSAKNGKEDNNTDDRVE